MEKGDVVSVVAMSGEYDGILDKIENDTVILQKPRMVIQTQEGMGFARGIAVTGEENPEEVLFSNVVFVVPTNDAVAKAHTEATTSIQLVK